MPPSSPRRPLPCGCGLLLCAVAMALPVPVGAQTVVGPDPIEELTWTPEGSPYRVVGQPQVEVGAHLVIEGGVVVEFEQGGRLHIKGSLTVDGTESSPVVLGPGVEGETWQGIFLHGTAGPTLLSNVQLRRASFGVLSQSNAELVVERGLFVDNTTHLLAQGSTLRVGRTAFVGGETGINATGSATLMVTNSIFAHNDEAGVLASLSDDPGTSEITHCTFDDVGNLGGLQVAIRAASTGGTLRVANSTFSAIPTAFLAPGGGPAVIVVSHSNVFDVERVSSGPVDVGDGMLFEDPRFASIDDYHPMPDSPLIDTGQQAGHVTIDLEGSPRPALDGFDIGAFEVQYVPICGNSETEFGESCDDGNQIDDDGCSSSCRFPGCGDATVDGEEECDDGNTSNLDACLDTCRLPWCGDGFVNVAGEECDDGNASDLDACATNCTLTKTSEVSTDKNVVDTNSTCGVAVGAPSKRPFSPMALWLVAAAIAMRERVHRRRSSSSDRDREGSR